MSSHHHRHHNHSGQKPARPGLHRNWRLWVAVGLMLAAMGIYVLTLDDAVQPGASGPNDVTVTAPAPASQK